MCTNNCNQDPCGCKTSTDDVVYKGPNLSCTGINNCDTLTTAIEKINDYMCSIELVQVILYNIVNNSTLYNQFTTIVNNSVDCQTVWDCIGNITTTTTTTAGKTVYELLRTSTSEGSAIDGCLNLPTPSVTVYISMDTPPTLEVGDILYTDNLGVTPFAGALKWWKLEQGVNTYSCQVSNSGEILTKNICI
jgi:hypothetical protein